VSLEEVEVVVVVVAAAEAALVVVVEATAVEAAATDLPLIEALPWATEAMDTVEA
jgi:hypothetical protein